MLLLLLVCMGARVTGTGKTLVDGGSSHARVKAWRSRVAAGGPIALAREAVAARPSSRDLVVVIRLLAWA